MKRLAAIASFFAVAAVASAVAPRTYIERSNNVSALLYDRFSWSQTDEVQIDLWPRSYGGALDLDGWFPMLFVSDPITEMVYIGKTGTVVAAGHVRFDLQREESNLSVSNLYLLSARLYHVSDVATQYVTIARGQLNIHWSPDAESYDLVPGRAVTSMVFNVTIISSGATSGASGSWTNLTQVPLGFADGTDDTDDTVQWSEISDLVGDGSNQVARGDHGHADLVSNSTLASTAAYFRARMDDLEGQIEGSGGGGGTTTNNFYVNVDNSTHVTGMVGFVVAYTNVCCLPPTTNGGVVTYYENTNSGSGTGVSATPINGVTPTNWTFNASYPFTITTTTNAQGGTITYGLAGSAGTVVIPAGNTSTSEIYFVSTNAQYYTAAPTATQLFFFGISAAAGFSAGARGQGYYACTGSQVFACWIPQGGLAVSNAVAPGGWGYVRGGSATSTNGYIAVSGAGSLMVMTGTNVVMHIGGAAGSGASVGRTHAGGLVGGSLGLTTSGGPGTQTNHGAAATAAAGATSGTDTNGGNATAAGGINPGHGGGGGHKSGGAGCASASSGNNSGGAGSTFVDALIVGYTDRSPSDSASPPGTDAPMYRSPYGVAITAGVVITNNNRGNSGFLSVISFPSHP